MHFARAFIDKSGFLGSQDSVVRSMLPSSHWRSGPSTRMKAKWTGSAAKECLAPRHESMNDRGLSRLHGRRSCPRENDTTKIFALTSRWQTERTHTSPPALAQGCAGSLETSEDTWSGRTECALPPCHGFLRGDCQSDN